MGTGLFFDNSAPLGGGGGFHPPTPLDPPTPLPPERLGPIFFRTFGQSKNFSGAFGANLLDNKFPSASQTLSTTGEEGGPPPHPSKGALGPGSQSPTHTRACR